MLALTANRERHRSTLSAAVLFISALICARAVDAQQLPFGLMVQPAQVELTAPHVEVISGPAAARLEQAKQLAAARSWDEAIDIWRELIEDKSNRVVALDTSRYLSLRRYCNLQIARLP